MSTAMSIRQRALGHQRSAKLALAPHDTAHEITVMVDSGSLLADLTTRNT